jgi:tRNA/tmRNA/rRNA uracil-C5-methylase (TrmA/RlmC/RlmD family)
VSKQSRPRREYPHKQSAKTRPPQKGKNRIPAKGVESSKDKPLRDEGPTAVTFAGLLRPLIAAPAGPGDTVTLQSSPLAHLDYPEELRIKNQALGMFWTHFRLPGQPEPIISSPKPRRYRTTSKRKTILKGNTLYLLFNDRALRFQKKPFIESPLDPREHGRIFEFLQQKISEPAFKLVAVHLNYLIIRGSYTERAVIFNVDTLNGPLVRKLKLLAGHLQKLPDPISSVSIYPDPSCSDYYLEEGQPSDILKFKKLFGKKDITVNHKGFRYSYHPTSFSQVNEAMVPVMLDIARALLEPEPNQTFLDLYCGYGLFSHFLAPGYKQVVGIDAEGPAIQAAIFNKKFNPASKKARFLARRITARSVEKIPLPDDLGAETILLDPPRQGTQEGVISALSRREPRKVLHIHCGVDQIPDSLRQWKQHGYRIRRIVPLDMFPGTAGLEVLILLEKGRG